MAKVHGTEKATSHQGGFFQTCFAITVDLIHADQINLTRATAFT
jgi:hypothetical protein